jgi:alanyl-tRNA synthetase
MLVVQGKPPNRFNLIFHYPSRGLAIQMHTRRGAGLDSGGACDLLWAVIKGDNRMTRQYYTDSYTRAFRARVIERAAVDGQPALVLDATYFYPTGGGQPHDAGTINGVAVVDVVSRASDKAVLHVLTEPVADETVECAIDWARRFDHMQQHTGQHILTQAIIQTAGAPTVGFHLSDETVTIDLDGLLTLDALTKAEDLANRIVWEDRTVEARLVGWDETEGVRMRRLPGELATDGLRVIDIDGFDQTACGGTHVARTGEIGVIKLVRTDKRGDKTRLEFRCGGRALHDYRLKNAVVNGLTADLTVGVEELRAAVGRLQDGLRETQRSLKAASGRLLEADAAVLLATAEVGGGARLVTQVLAGREASELRQLAGLLTKQPGVIALLAAPGGERASVVFARSEDVKADMNALLKSALATLSGGKGGGQAHLAQGGALADSAALQAALLHAAGQLSG